MEFRFPDVGEGITEGEIVKWLVKEGEKVKEDQPLVEIETDKAIVEIPVPQAGTILKLHYGEGETVKVGSVLVTLGEEGAAPKVEEARRPSTTVVGVLEEAEEEEVAKPEEKAAVEKKEAEERPVQATPAARRLATELGIALAQVQGTAPEGAVTEGDVRAAAEKKPAVKVTKKYDMYGYIERIPLKGIRKATARRMAESWEKVPRVTHMDEADVTTLVRLREKAKKEAEGKGVKLTYLPFLIKACIAALKEYPYLNATLEGEEIVLKKYYNIGIATDTGEGLMVPVVKGADQKSIFQIAQEIEALAKAAQARTIDLADLKGGTFTITNIGVIGGTYATPIVNYPEVAILATGKIHERPVARDGKIEVRKVLPLSLSFDHRVADGAYAARFVTRLIEHLENPGLLFLEK
ncbi:MAG: 2-oxo acid dehydrogenase subunit E2 [Euryarchaeota archaeon]|nr:2-oxo acid dehydrogenase subunit E2 [Euryarchaeota archaeon]